MAHIIDENENTEKNDTNRDCESAIEENMNIFISTGLFF